MIKKRYVIDNKKKDRYAINKNWDISQQPNRS